jgi:hypothetical protein
VLLLLLAAAPASSRADGATYWGGTIKGDTYGEATDAPRNQAVLDRFEREAGKHVTMINTGQGWAAFDTATMQATVEAGAIPLVTMGLGSGVSLADVAAGAQDSQIRTWATKAKEWGYPFLFRPWWEPNGDWYTWGRSPDYVPAWRHFHEVVEEVGATNVTWAWIVNNIWWDPASDPTPYYPGNAYVDWVGMDAYNWGLNPLQSDRWLTPEQIIDPTMEILKELAPGKPVCICEDAATEMGGNKASWIDDMLRSYLPHHPEIQAYLWFNWNVQDGPGRWDWPIGSSLAAQESFRSGIQSSIYLSSLPPLTKLAKVPTPTPPATPVNSGPDLPSPTLADGHWSQSVGIASGGSDSRDAQVAVGPKGVATCVWVEYDGANYVIRERRLGLAGIPSGPARTLSEAGQDAFDPQVAVDPRGIATVVWKRFDGSTNIIQERRVLANGELEATAHDLSASGQFAGQPQVATATDGRAIVVWERYSGFRSVIQERQIYYYNTPAGTTYTLSDGQQNAVEPQVVVDAGGNATVVWDRYSGSEQIVQARRIDATGLPAIETRNLSAPGGDAIEPSIAIGPDGTATVVWTRFDGADQVIQAQQISDEGAPVGAVGDVSAPGRSAVAPDVTVGPDGAAILVWQRVVGSHLIVQERRFGSDGSLGPDTANLSNLTRDSYEPRVAAAGDGTASVLWDEAREEGPVVRARRIDASGTPQEETVSLSSAGQGSGSPAISAGSGSEAIAVWRAFDGVRDSIEGSAFGDPRVELTPGSHDFGALEIGESIQRTFKIKNTGNAALAISSLTLAGEDAGQFTAPQPASCGGPLLPGESCQFSVAFEPSEDGTFSANLEVVSDATSSPDTAALTGNGVPPPPGEEPRRPPPPQDDKVGPASDFSVGRVKLKRDGSAVVRLGVPGPGALDLSASGATIAVVGKGASRHPLQHLALFASGVVTLRLAARGHAHKLLDERGKARIMFRATYTPTGGEPLTRALPLLLKAAPS